MLIFELSGITGIWVTNLHEDKKILHFENQGIFFRRENDGTQVLKGRNVAKTFENHCHRALKLKILQSKYKIRKFAYLTEKSTGVRLQTIVDKHCFKPSITLSKSRSQPS